MALSNIKIKTTEMHTGGHCVRIVEEGFPEIDAPTVRDKVRYIRKHYGDIWKFLVLEPRGRRDMMLVVLVKPDLPGADLGCIFIDNMGCLTMCGLAVIATSRYVVDKGIVESPTSPETRVLLQCPCGPVETFVQYKDGKTGSARFNSVPSFVYALDVKTEVAGYGELTVDIVFSGCFYAVLSVQQLGLDMSAVAAVAAAGYAITGTLKKTVKLTHPESDDLAFFLGTMITDGKEDSDETATITITSNKQVDRSPCGSGTTGRVVLQYAKGYIQLNQSRTFVGPSGSKFVAKPIKEVKHYGYDALVVEVSGRGYYTGTSTYTYEEEDKIGRGFLLD